MKKKKKSTRGGKDENKNTILKLVTSRGRYSFGKILMTQKKLKFKLGGFSPSFQPITEQTEAKRFQNLSRTETSEEINQ